MVSKNCLTVRGWASGGNMVWVKIKKIKGRERIWKKSK